VQRAKRKIKRNAEITQLPTSNFQRRPVVVSVVRRGTSEIRQIPETPGRSRATNRAYEKELLMHPIIPFIGLAFLALVLVTAIIARVALRWQRQQHLFLLQKAAIERGTPLSDTDLKAGEAPNWLRSLRGDTPSWLRTMRKGVVLLVVGLGFLGIGVFSRREAAARLATIDTSTLMAAETQPREAPQAPLPPPPPPGMGNEGQGGPGVPPAFDGPRDGGRRLDFPPPPRMTPQLERWRHSQDEYAIGTTFMWIGGILAPAGAVLAIFAFIERKYARAV
jgi:hypothetical protein